MIYKLLGFIKKLLKKEKKNDEHAEKKNWGIGA